MGKRLFDFEKMRKPLRAWNEADMISYNGCRVCVGGMYFLSR